MSGTSSTDLMDTAPGGENTQCESTSMYNESPAKQEGQLGSSSKRGTSEEAHQEKSNEGERAAENIRCGQALSEQGFGGQIIDNSGDVQQEGYGRLKEHNGEQRTAHMREEQGYGEGSGVGA